MASESDSPPSSGGDMPLKPGLIRFFLNNGQCLIQFFFFCDFLLVRLVNENIHGL